MSPAYYASTINIGVFRRSILDLIIMKIRSSVWTEGRADAQTERHDETNSHFSQLCGRAENNVLVFSDVTNSQFIISRG